jgi:hypothetical protein
MSLRVVQVVHVKYDEKLHVDLTENKVKQIYFG